MDHFRAHLVQVCMFRDGSGEDWASPVCEQVCMVLVVSSSMLRWTSILVLVVGNCRHMHGWGCGQVYNKRATVWSRSCFWATVGDVCKCIGSGF